MHHKVIPETNDKSHVAWEKPDIKSKAEDFEDSIKELSRDEQKGRDTLPEVASSAGFVFTVAWSSSFGEEDDVEI